MFFIQMRRPINKFQFSSLEILSYHRFVIIMKFHLTKYGKHFQSIDMINDVSEMLKKFKKV